MVSFKTSSSTDFEAAIIPSTCGTRLVDRLSGVRDRLTGCNLPGFLRSHLRKLLLLAAGICGTVGVFVVLGELRSYAANQRVDSAVLPDSTWDRPIPVSFNATDPAF